MSVKTLFNVIVTPGTPVIVTPGATEFFFVARKSGGAEGVITAEASYATEFGGWTALKNAAGNNMTALATNLTQADMTSIVASPGVDALRFTATTAPVRVIGKSNTPS